MFRKALPPRPSPPLDALLTSLNELLMEVVSLQKGPVASICPDCEDVCCRRVGFLFDEKDVIYQSLSGRTVPRRSAGRPVRGCPFLSPVGCRLRPEARPFTCHRYLCTPLKQIIGRQAPDRVKRMGEQIAAIDALRGRLWTAYLDGLA